MKNPNSPISKLKRHLKVRWSQEDYPGGEPRFQISMLAKDLAIFVCLPLISVVLVKSCESNGVATRKPNAAANRNSDLGQSSEAKSQIIDFQRPTLVLGRAGFARKSPGTLVKVRLLNVVETYSTAPVHAQIVDAGLGAGFVGGTLIGDATPDTNFERINISFRFARDPNRAGLAASVAARALGLDGTLGLEARKREGFVARSVASSAQSASQNFPAQSGDSDFKQILFRALTAGLMQEFGTSAQVEKNRSQVLSLTPSTEFFAELTDFFPGAAQ